MKAILVTIILIIALYCKDSLGYDTRIGKYNLLNDIELLEYQLETSSYPYCNYMKLGIRSNDTTIHKLWITNDLRKQHWEEVILVEQEPGWSLYMSDPLVVIAPSVQESTVTAIYQHIDGTYEYVPLHNIQESFKDCQAKLINSNRTELSITEVENIYSSTPNPPTSDKLELNITIRSKMVAAVELTKYKKDISYINNYHWNNEIAHMYFSARVFEILKQKVILTFEEVYSLLWNLMQHNPTFYSNLSVKDSLMNNLDNYRYRFSSADHYDLVPDIYRYAKLHQKLEQLQEDPNEIISLEFPSLFRNISYISAPVAYISTVENPSPIKVKIGTSYPSSSSVKCMYITRDLKMHVAPYCTVVNNVCECEIGGSDSPDTPIRYDLNDHNQHLTYLVQHVDLHDSENFSMIIRVLFYATPFIACALCVLSGLFLAIAIIVVVKTKARRKRLVQSNYQSI